MQPLQYDLQSSAAKDNSITHAAAAASNLDAATPMRSASTDSKTPYNYAHTTTPKAAWSHRYTAATKKNDKPTAGRTRRTDEVPFIVACSHFTRKNTRFRAPASSPKQRPLQHHAAIPMRSASTDSKTPYNYAHTSTPKAAWSHRYTAAKKKNDQPTAAAPAAQTRYLSSSPAATLHGKTQGFVLWASSPQQSPCNIMQPFQCDLQAQIPKHAITTHTQAHPKQLEATVTLRQKKNDQPTAAAPAAQTRYLSSSPAATLHGKTQGFVLRLPPQLTTSLPHHFPSSPLPIVTTPLRHHFPSSPLPFLTTPLHHHFPSSPLPFVTTSLPHHFPSSPLPFIITSLLHRFPSSPLPFIITSSRSIS